MAKKSKNKFILMIDVIWEGICIYLKYFGTFFKYMLFPVFGQIIGLCLIFTVSYLFVVNISSLIKQYPLLDSITLVFILLLICVFPGFLIFCKAFFDYIIAYSSLNSMVYVSRGEKMKNKPLDTKVHDNLLKKRIGKYIVMLLLMSILGLAGAIPLFIIPYGILFVYLSLMFQVFMLEEKITPISAFSRSFELVKGNFWMTSGVIVFSCIITYLIIPSVFIRLLKQINVIEYLSIPIQKYLNILPINEILSSFWYSVTSPLTEIQIPSSVNIDFYLSDVIPKLAVQITDLIITMAVIGLLLPLRCAWFTLLYKLFDTEKTEELRRIDLKKK